MRGAHWLWVNDLSQLETLPIHILPIVMIVTQFMHAEDDAGQRRRRSGPAEDDDVHAADVRIHVLQRCPAALVLYWLTGNLVGIAQQCVLQQDGDGRATCRSRSSAGKKRRTARNRRERAEILRQFDQARTSMNSCSPCWTRPGSIWTMTSAEAESVQPDFETPDIVVQVQRAGCGSAAGEQRRAAAGAGASHHGSAAHAVGRSFAAFPSTRTITGCCGSRNCG